MEATHTNLKLRAETPQDIALLGLYLQDALVSVGGMQHHREDCGFSLFVNRFQWEKDPVDTDEGLMHGRTHAGVHFSHVNHVRHRNIPVDNHAHFLNLLHCHAHAPGEVHFMFSGDCELCLHVDKILCHLMDMGDPWHTPHKPLHQV